MRSEEYCTIARNRRSLRAPAAARDNSTRSSADSSCATMPSRIARRSTGSGSVVREQHPFARGRAIRGDELRPHRRASGRPDRGRRRAARRSRRSLWASCVFTSTDAPRTPATWPRRFARRRTASVVTTQPMTPVAPDLHHGVDARVPHVRAIRRRHQVLRELSQRLLTTSVDRLCLRQIDQSDDHQHEDHAATRWRGCRRPTGRSRRRDRPGPAARPTRTR